IDFVSERFPQIKLYSQNRFAATPLSFRDYLGTYDGSLYGIQKDFRDPVKTMVPPRTKIRNIFLTGQNINLHGVVGVSLSALLTCGCLIDLDLLLHQIRSANA